MIFYDYGIAEIGTPLSQTVLLHLCDIHSIFYISSLKHSIFYISSLKISQDLSGTKLMIGGLSEEDIKEEQCGGCKKEVIYFIVACHGFVLY